MKISWKQIFNFLMKFIKIEYVVFYLAYFLRWKKRRKKADKLKRFLRKKYFGEFIRNELLTNINVSRNSKEKRYNAWLNRNGSKISINKFIFVWKEGSTLYKINKKFNGIESIIFINIFFFLKLKRQISKWIHANYEDSRFFDAA